MIMSGGCWPPVSMFSIMRTRSWSLAPPRPHHWTDPLGLPRSWKLQCSALSLARRTKLSPTIQILLVGVPEKKEESLASNLFSTLPGQISFTGIVGNLPDPLVYKWYHPYYMYVIQSLSNWVINPLTHNIITITYTTLILCYPRIVLINVCKYILCNTWTLKHVYY